MYGKVNFRVLLLYDVTFSLIIALETGVVCFKKKLNEKIGTR